jgi:hypothetical protein
MRAFVGTVVCLGLALGAAAPPLVIAQAYPTKGDTASWRQDGLYALRR